MRTRIPLIAVCLLLPTTACSDPDVITLTVCSGRTQDIVEPLFGRFVEETGVHLEVRHAESIDLAATLREEGGNSPADCWGTRFLGEAEFVAGTAGGRSIDTALGSFPPVPGQAGPVEVMSRPESVEILPGGDDATVADREYYGHHQLVTLRMGDGSRLLSLIGPHPPVAPGERVGVLVREIVAFPASPGHHHRRQADCSRASRI